MKKNFLIDQMKNVKNLDRFVNLLSLSQKNRPSLLVHSAISTGQSFNDLMLNYKRICYFGHFPDVFLQNISNEVLSKEDRLHRKLYHLQSKQKNVGLSI